MSKAVTPIQGDELSAIAANMQALIASHQTLSLSTLSATGRPEISYTPFLQGKDGRFYIFISELAHHTPNLLANVACAILFAAPEAETKNPFARERAFFNCEAEELPRGTDACDQYLSKLRERFGKTVELLRQLPDFHLFALTPLEGQYTVGFGKAFRVDSEGRLSHIVIDKKS